MPELDDALAATADMERELDGVAPGVPRLLHGFGATSWAVLDVAVERGYQVRIGLEDTVVGRDGTPVSGNADLVRAAVAAFGPTAP